MNKRFEDKVVLVTGGNRGIGKAACRAFAEEGAKVVLTYVSHGEEGEEAAEEIRKEGGEAMAVKVDVSSEDDIASLVDKVMERHGRIDVLVNNAGILIQENLVDMEADTVRKILDVNLLGMILVTKAVLPHMIKADKGRVVNVASQIGQIGSEKLAAYAASKGGVIAFTKALARELGSGGMKTNILVNCVAPGPIETDLIADMPDEWKKSMREGLPLGRMGKPEEVAPAILFLSCEDSALFIGQVISPNSGDTMVG